VLNYEEAMEYLKNTSKFGMNLGLRRVERLLEYMGNPEKELRCIHIGGTNGKGSVTSMISSVLMECGYKVGIYTSPYLQRFTERIKINNDEIEKNDIARLMTYIKPLVQRLLDEGYDHPTEFELITAIMFKYFNEKKVDIAVIEVGLGGRLDSTNVIDPLVSVITSIDYDHMNILGNTLGEIAYEKAGIIKKNGIAVVYPQRDEALSVIKKVCGDRNARLIEVEEKGIYLKHYSLDGQVFDLKVHDESYIDLKMKLLGEHQLLNAKTAITALKALKYRGIEIDKEKIFQGFKKVTWPGRLEVMRKNPVLLLDGAHNLQGVKSLKDALGKYFNYNNLILVMGILRDKQVEDMCQILTPIASAIITTEPESERALKADELGKIASKYCPNVIVCRDINEAFSKGESLAREGDILLFCGSLYLIGHVRTLVEEKRQ